MSFLENELKLLQEKEWSKDERIMIKSLIDNIKYYRKLIPNSLKKDICEALDMCNKLKMELDTYREYCKKRGIVYSNGEIINENEECQNIDVTLPEEDIGIVIQQGVVGVVVDNVVDNVVNVVEASIGVIDDASAISFSNV